MPAVLNPLIRPEALRPKLAPFTDPTAVSS